MELHVCVCVCACGEQKGQKGHASKRGMTACNNKGRAS